MKQKLDIWKCLCLITILAILIAFAYAKISDQKDSTEYSDGIVQIDPNTIKLTSEGVTVSFSEVILSKPEETRKLIVCEQDATIEFQMTDSMVKALDVSWLKRNQKVSYKAKGYFVVDLDKITEEDLVDDPEEKTLTIRIKHSYLETVAIDPDQVVISEADHGVLAWGEIKMTIESFNEIEKEIKSRMEKKFNTAQNAQQADDTALQMVKEIYEPIVHAVDDEYEVKVEFRQ